MTAKNLVPENEFFTTQIDGAMLAIRWKKFFLHFARDMQKIFSFYDFLDLAVRNPDIRVMVTIGARGQEGRTESHEFLCYILAADKGHKLLNRFLNLTNNFVTALASSNLVTIHALQGRCSFFQLYLSLAYDYRIASADTVFENPNADLGLISKGGGGYFMGRLLGVKKAAEVMQWREFSAEDALQMGLVDKVVPPDKLESETLALGRGYTDASAALLLDARKLLKCDPKELERSLEFEDQLLKSRLNSADFRKSFIERCRCLDVVVAEE